MEALVAELKEVFETENLHVPDSDLRLLLDSVNPDIEDPELYVQALYLKMLSH